VGEEDKRHPAKTKRWNQRDCGKKKRKQMSRNSDRVGRVVKREGDKQKERENKRNIVEGSRERRRGRGVPGRSGVLRGQSGGGGGGREGGDGERTG
jgi:hypothetical protein